MHVAVVIPARQAEATIAACLDSLLAQTFSRWEAIVVDDGSTDATASIAARYAAIDVRIRVITQRPCGISRARNAGIAATSSEWLLFLDADDWLLPLALERLTAAGNAPSLDAVYGGWVRVTPGGQQIAEPYTPDERTIFVTLAGFCPFAIHACVVRRQAVEQLEGFDPSLQSCEDWDLWQRVARTGARFVAITDVVACYRMRPHSASRDALRLLDDGLRTIDIGHGPDPRVARPHPAYAAGVPQASRAAARLTFVCWIAGLLLGRGDDPLDALTPVRDDRAPALSPANVAQSLFTATLLPTCRAPAAWLTMWPRVQLPLGRFLDALETQAGANGLATAARRRLEALIRNYSSSNRH
jgi:Glycosyl transferase family 2